MNRWLASLILIATLTAAAAVACTQDMEPSPGNVDAGAGGADGAVNTPDAAAGQDAAPVEDAPVMDGGDLDGGDLDGGDLDGGDLDGGDLDGAIVDPGK